ncbi:hypothetical protein B0H11DRAFT_1637861, partial [Mycena galericulata]
LDKEFLAFLLLHSLPTTLKWESFKSSTLNGLGAGATLNFDDVSERLIAEVTRVEGDTEETPATESALKTSKNPKRSKSKKWCDFHRSPSHNTDDCKTLAAQKESSKKDRGKEKRKRAKAHRADEASDSDSESEDSDSGSSSDSEDDRAQFSAKSSKSKARSHNVKVSKSLMTRIHGYLGTETKFPEHDMLIDSGASGHM